MKLIVLGANGRTGVHVVSGAVARGHDVCAVVRSADKAPDVGDRAAAVAVGDPLDVDFLTSVMVGHDAVISTLGGRGPTKSASSIYPRSATAIVGAARETGVDRVLVSSTALLFEGGGLLDRVLPFLLRGVVANARQMEATLRGAELRWTIGRCGFLSDDDTGAYEAEPGARPSGGTKVSRRALAGFLLDALDDPETESKVFGLGSGS